MQLRTILLAVVASALTTTCGAFTAEDVGLVTLSKSGLTDHKATDQRAERRLRKHDTVGDENEINQDSQDEARGLQVPPWLANIVGNLDDVEKALTKLTKGQSNLEITKHYDTLVKDIADSFVKLERVGYTPTKLQNAIKNKEMVVENPHLFLEAFQTYWRTVPRLKPLA
ncbi:secreted RxLR effector peptide protein, putative [Phytophthora infestans T30-4]|uniref:RxLR effector protein n=2 Tax=Phytophthora infestans TaxID=4787 RepID=D0NRT0_PHYIT|nr:secreted RxLR effector peptide protein, putative [Phytophthora infestans T30-4]EEY63430.1 secreted RxLR effector peptide protein, putative [Phytophthora infestans T30-4]KAF4140215.1 RXLR effector domain-containing protein [Phytophthora infestans]|eukprot:XP_002898315.1 secreted RxLR effector peptide protein, putative [Phytophthora infestans T30-4]